MDNQDYVNPDGQLRFRVETATEGDVTLGFVGYMWHTHADMLAGATGLSENVAVQHFVDDLLGGRSVIAMWSYRGEIRDVRVTSTPEREALLLENEEAIELRYWDGRAWEPTNS